jgi:hypothetical protein
MKKRPQCEQEDNDMGNPANHSDNELSKYTQLRQEKKEKES